MQDAFRIAAAAALIVAAGVVHGAWTNRWGNSAALAETAAKVDLVPLTVGDWRATSSVMDERIRAMAGAVGYLSRVYRDHQGRAVSVMLICGLPGDVATHTPDACYPGAGYALGPQEVVGVRDGLGRSSSFRTATATRGGATPSSLRIFWAWNDARGWSAPGDARWSFASAPALFKLYVIRETVEAGGDATGDPCVEFLRDFLPTLDSALFAPGGAVAAAAH
ncbi:exosortase-associated EpsI family protein [Paludisphaera soli]|uniref:exosortase-associated EpsI family protein n=1 Tax=Paludisphaera soli TaxID=2712865 RepID=UPI0013EDEB64|nr:exosortase-associated EpsI family protein [Paludisphaera soli]